MKWKINYLRSVTKSIKKIDPDTRKKIRAYLEKRVSNANHPTDFGKPLKHSMHGLWRYRVGDYRIICRIENDILTVLVININHRKKVYK